MKAEMSQHKLLELSPSQVLTLMNRRFSSKHSIVNIATSICAERKDITGSVMNQILIFPWPLG